MQRGGRGQSRRENGSDHIIYGDLRRLGERERKRDGRSEQRRRKEGKQKEIRVRKGFLQAWVVDESLGLGGDWD